MAIDDQDGSGDWDGSAEVPVEDLFNGVINVLGDGLELAIIGGGKLIHFLAKAPEMTSFGVKSGAAALGATMTRLTGGSAPPSVRRPPDFDDETGLE